MVYLPCRQGRSLQHSSVYFPYREFPYLVEATIKGKNWLSESQFLPLRVAFPVKGQK